MEKKICCLFLIFAFTSSNISLNFLHAQGNVPSYSVPIGSDLRIDLEYLFGPNPRNIHIYHERRVFDFYANGPTAWIFNVRPEYEGIVILNDGKGNIYAFELAVIQPTIPITKSSTDTRHESVVNIKPIRFYFERKK